MDTKEQIPNSDKSFEKQVFEALKHYGYKVPKSDEEVAKYVRMFGSTKVELPHSLMDAGALFDNAKKGNMLLNGKEEIMGMAARGDSEDILPDHIAEKIKEDLINGKWLK